MDQVRAIIQVESGLKEGHRFVLSHGQLLKFGRTEWADAVFNSDASMSGVHFSVEFQGDACIVADLDSKHGTFVNGQPISRVIAHTGDRIRAGKTTFRVELEGVPAAGRGGESEHRPPVETLIANQQATFTVEACKSTVNCYRGSVLEMPPARLTKMLGKTYQTTLILSLHKLDRPPRSLVSPEYLFNWLPDELREENSPILLSDQEQFGDFGIVLEAWGKDTLIAVFSEKDHPLPIDQLRRCAGVYTRPSFLRAQLGDTVAELANDFLLEVEAVLVETESTQDWALYSLTNLEPMLIELGIQKAPDDVRDASCPAGSETV